MSRTQDQSIVDRRRLEREKTQRIVNNLTSTADQLHKESNVRAEVIPDAVAAKLDGDATLADAQQLVKSIETTRQRIQAHIGEREKAKQALEAEIARKKTIKLTLIGGGVFLVFLLHLFVG